MESGRHNRPSAHFSKCENSALDLLAALLYFLGNVDWIFRFFYLPLTRFYRFQFFQSKLMRKTSEKVYHIAITADWFADKTRFTNQQALFYMDECARSDCPWK